MSKKPTPPPTPKQNPQTKPGPLREDLSKVPQRRNDEGTGQIPKRKN